MEKYANTVLECTCKYIVLTECLTRKTQRASSLTLHEHLITLLFCKGIRGFKPLFLLFSFYLLVCFKFVLSLWTFNLSHGYSSLDSQCQGSSVHRAPIPVARGVRGVRMNPPPLKNNKHC